MKKLIYIACLILIVSVAMFLAGCDTIEDSIISEESSSPPLPSPELTVNFDGEQEGVGGSWRIENGVTIVNPTKETPPGSNVYRAVIMDFTNDALIYAGVTANGNRTFMSEEAATGDRSSFGLNAKGAVHSQSLTINAGKASGHILVTAYEVNWVNNSNVWTNNSKVIRVNFENIPQQ